MQTCLIVDDSSIIRKVSRRIVEGLGMRVLEADDGLAAIDRCTLAMPDAILLDSHMPNLDGYGFLQHLRTMPNGEKPKVIFMALPDDRTADIARAMQAGANVCLIKPFDHAGLRAKFVEAGLGSMSER